MGILGHEEILELHAAVVSARLGERRAGLLAGLSADLVANLVQSAVPGEQVLMDLESLNTTLLDGSTPLAVWLANAVALSRPRSEVAVFEDALARVRRALEGSPRQGRRSIGGGPSRDGERADVLIVTAVKDEWDAVLAVDTGATSGSAWEKRTGPIGLEVAFREFTTAGGVLRVAVTQALGMGGANAAIAAAQILADYQVRCLAMCGVCAGRRGDVALGDVIIADRLWQYDTGKLKVEIVDGQRVEREQGDMEMYRLQPPAWKQAAERFEIDRGAAWPALRPLSYEAQGDWILERIYRGKDPVKDPERGLKCANFNQALRRLWTKELLDKGTLKFAAAGQEHIAELLLANLDDLPAPTPLMTHVGPIASGNQVIEDERIFARLADPVRKVLGVEMEAATIGALASAQGVPFSIVMKAVMDHADADKSDNFKPFAARASAECLIAFLRQNLPSRVVVDEPGKEGVASPESESEPAPPPGPLVPWSQLSDADRKPILQLLSVFGAGNFARLSLLVKRASTAGPAGPLGNAVRALCERGVALKLDLKAENSLAVRRGLDTCFEPLREPSALYPTYLEVLRPAVLAFASILSSSAPSKESAREIRKAARDFAVTRQDETLVRALDEKA